MRVQVTAALMFEFELELSPNTHDNQVVQEVYNVSWSDQIIECAQSGRYDINDIWVFDDDGNQIY